MNWDLLGPQASMMALIAYQATCGIDIRAWPLNGANVAQLLRSRIVRGVSCARNSEPCESFPRFSSISANFACLPRTVISAAGPNRTSELGLHAPTVGHPKLCPCHWQWGKPAREPELLLRQCWLLNLYQGFRACATKPRYRAQKFSVGSK